VQAGRPNHIKTKIGWLFARHPDLGHERIREKSWKGQD
jgi:hypothetical protein